MLDKLKAIGDGMEMGNTALGEIKRLRIALETSNRMHIAQKAYELGLIDKARYMTYIKKLLEGGDIHD